jgi:DUF4097 and DUF4098 domain-containing protein YvlB
VTAGRSQRTSSFIGLLLILLGALFLVSRYYPQVGLGHLIRVYWPLIIVLWGVSKLIDHFAAHRTGQPAGPILSGGEVALVILLILVLVGFVSRDWVREHGGDIDVDFPFHNSYTQQRELTSQTIPAGSHIVIETERGDLDIHASDGNQITGNAKESAAASSQSEADDEMRNVEVHVEQDGNTYRIHPLSRSHGHVSVDLAITVPKSSSVDVSTGHGDIKLAGIDGDISAHSGSGDIEIRDAGGNVNVYIQKGDLDVNNVAGNFTLNGHGDDVNVENVKGGANIEGPFTGTIRARNLGNGIRFVSPWADVSISHLAGRIDADSGDISISDASGPVKLITHNKDISVENVNGKLEIANTHGDVKVSYAAAPRDDLSITNDSGDVNVTLPAASSFGISAFSRSGDAENDFQGPELKSSDEGGHGSISGRYGNGGPNISVATSYGTVHIQKRG